MESTEKVQDGWKKNCVLTTEEGRKLEKIMLDFNCPNVSFLSRMIVNGYIETEYITEDKE